jgi:hypothetical protein
MNLAEHDHLGSHVGSTGRWKRHDLRLDSIRFREAQAIKVRVLVIRVGPHMVVGRSSDREMGPKKLGNQRFSVKLRRRAL